MRFRAAAACAALIAIPVSACDVQVDVEPDRAGLSEIDPLPDVETGTDVWVRDSRVVVVDEPLSIHLELRLRRDRTFLFVAEVEDGDGDRERETAEGRYRWEGDRLVLVEEDGEGDQVLRLRGDELELETEWPVDVLLAVTGLPEPALRRAR